MAVRWWTCEGLQIPASVSSEHGPTKRVRRATATPLMPPMVQWILCSSSPLEGSALRIWWASAYSAPLPETTQQRPLISPTPPSSGSANLRPASIALRSRHWTRKSGCQAPPTSIAGAKRSQYAGRILCVDSVLLDGHGVVVCLVGTEPCWQLQCALPKE